MKFEDYKEHVDTNTNKEDVADNARIIYKKHIAEPIIDARPFAEPEPRNLSISILQQNLGNCLSIIDDEVMKGYVTRLDQLPIIIQKDEVYEKLEPIHFFKISELVYHYEDEFSVDKLSMIFQALANKPCTLVLMLKSDGKKTDFYLGTRPNGERSAGTLFQMLKEGLQGFFPGSQISEYYDDDLKKDLDKIKDGCKCISSATSVADYKRDQEGMTNKEFVQGLEKFVYAMVGKAYTAILIANNLSYDELMFKKREYEQIYTQISPFANMQMSFSVNDSISDSNGSSEGTTHSLSYAKTQGTAQTVTDTTTHTIGSSESQGETDTHTDNESVSDGKTHTTGETDGTSRTVTNTDSISIGTSTSVHCGVQLGPFNCGVSQSTNMTSSHSRSVAKGTSHTESVSDSISKTLTHGFSDSKGITKTTATSQSDSQGKTLGETLNVNDTYTAGETFNLVNNKSITDTFGTSKGMTLNAQNMTLNLAMKRLQAHLERIEECESFGMWNFAAYFIGESAAETETAANIYKSVVAGTNSGIERDAINTWSDEDSIKNLIPYLFHFMHPQFVYTGFSYETQRYISVNPSALVSTNELAIHMGLPRYSVIGLPVVEHADFGKEVVKYSDEGEKKRELKMGNIFSMGRETDIEVKLDCDSLTMHTFITGSTGSGKSNTVYEILNQLRTLYSIPFLVVEPAKGEYKNIFGQFADVNVYGTNPKISNLLQINPFSFPNGVHVLEHLDRLVEIFNACWPMYAAMPAILKEAMEKAYVSNGWNLDTSENENENRFPNFADLLEQIKIVIDESKYSADSKGDYSGALLTRVRSLTTGINGKIFTANEISNSDLFDKNVIVDLSRVGSTETKSLIMGLMVMKLYEYRMDSGKMNVPLCHVTVLEEAHNLLKKTSTEQYAESTNLVGKSVELLANSIAEMRTYGEGFIIADQSPGLLDMSVIRNTNTKIILRLPEKTDRELVGFSAGLSEKQIPELAKLKKGVAAIYKNDWVEPILCNIDKYTYDEKARYTYTKELKDVAERQDPNIVLRQLLLQFLLKYRVKNPVDVDVDDICESLVGSDLSTRKKLSIQKILEEYTETGAIALWDDDKFERLSEMVSGLLDDCKNVRQIIEKAVHSKEELGVFITNLINDIGNEIYLNKEYSVAIAHCLLKNYSYNNSDFVDLYSGFITYNRQRGVI